jgi:hypothetical protein
VAELWYNWGNQTWMTERAKRNALIHLGSWRRVPEEGDRPLSYRELAPMNPTIKLIERQAWKARSHAQGGHF